MKEIGGYIELEHNYFPILHESAKALNCGTACLAYLIRAKKIKKLMIPFFLCDCIKKVCLSEGVAVRQYHICPDFSPEHDIAPASDEWIYLVNFYGQLSEEKLFNLVHKYDHIIVDNAHAFFEYPIRGVDTLYTCRKFFGVADGAFLYTDVNLEEEFIQDESCDRMHYLLGRFERTASEFYSEYVANNELLANEPIKRMSKLTDNLLRGIDYKRIKNIRTLNYGYLYERFQKINLLPLQKVEGAFSYPLLLHNGAFVRKELLKSNIYIPTLWPNVLSEMKCDSLEYHYAKNILPIPVDQRYGLDDMKRLVDIICEYIY